MATDEPPQEIPLGNTKPAAYEAGASLCSERHVLPGQAGEEGLAGAWDSGTARGPSSASPGGCPAGGQQGGAAGACRRLHRRSSPVLRRLENAGDAGRPAGCQGGCRVLVLAKGEPLRKSGKADAGGERSPGRAASRESGFQREPREGAGRAVMRGGGWWERGRRALEEARSCRGGGAGASVRRYVKILPMPELGRASARSALCSPSQCVQPQTRVRPVLPVLAVQPHAPPVLFCGDVAASLLFSVCSSCAVSSSSLQMSCFSSHRSRLLPFRCEQSVVTCPSPRGRGDRGAWSGETRSQRGSPGTVGPLLLGFPLPSEGRFPLQ